MGKPISEDGRIIQGKYEGYFVYLWETNESLSIHKERIYESGLLTASNKQSSQVFIINKDSITDTQDMGSAVHKANTEAVLKVGFWFGAVAAIAANQIGTRESYTVAIEYPDGERREQQIYQIIQMNQMIRLFLTKRKWSKGKYSLIQKTFKHQ